MTLFHATVDLIEGSADFVPEARHQYHSSLRDLLSEGVELTYELGDEQLNPNVARLYLGSGFKRASVLEETNSALKSVSHARNGAADSYRSLPRLAIHHALDRTFRHADVDVQYIQSVDHLVNPDILKGSHKNPDLAKFMRLLDQSDIILAGSKVCADHLQTYFGFDPKRIVPLPEAPVLSEAALSERVVPATDVSADIYAVIYLVAGPNAASARHAASIARAARELGTTIRIVAAWDESYGPGPAAHWRRSFDCCVPVASAQRQWLFSKAKTVVFWGENSAIEPVSAEAQLLSQSAVLPLSNPHKPVDYLGVERLACIHYVTPGMLSATSLAFCDALLNSASGPAVRDDIAELSRTWREAEVREMNEKWLSALKLACSS